jgi:hypothetical protein
VNPFAVQRQRRHSDNVDIFRAPESPFAVGQRQTAHPRTLSGASAEGGPLNQFSAARANRATAAAKRADLFDVQRQQRQPVPANQ